MSTSRSKIRQVRVRVRRLAHAAGLPLPAYQTDGAAGLDLVAAVPDGKPLRLKRGARALVPTGLVIELPSGYEAQVRPRSGLALRHGLTLLNTPGTVDSDYRGEVQVLLINLGEKTVTIARGERIAQLVVAPVSRARLDVAADLSATKRGEGGFGSTGRKTRRPAPPAQKSTKTAAPAPRRKRVPAGGQRSEGRRR